LLSDVNERRGLPGHHNIVGLVVDELEHEAPTIGGIEPKIAIALAFQRRRARAQPVHGQRHRLGVARTNLRRLTRSASRRSTFTAHPE